MYGSLAIAASNFPPITSKSQLRDFSSFQESLSFCHAHILFWRNKLSQMSWGFCIIWATVTPEGGKNAGSVNVDYTPFPTRELQNEARFAPEACVISVGKARSLEVGTPGFKSCFAID